jgi:pimeloyl-ACP methyl ester carboxylesterase
MARLKSLKAVNNEEKIQELINTEWLPQTTVITDLSPDLMESINAYATSPLVPYYLGTDLFKMDGSVTKWNREEELKSVPNQILFISGEKDYIRSKTTKSNAALVKNGHVEINNESSHLTPYEDPKGFVKSVMNFIERSF